MKAKELTIEQKAKRYDEAIEKFDVILNLNTVKESGTIFADDVRKILPELAESEGEKIRKALISYHKSTIDIDGIKGDEIVSWLEKQSEQKTEPKFKIGDYVKNTNYKGEPIYEIVYIDKECYICEYRGKERMGDKAVMHFSFDNPYLRLAQKPADKVALQFHKGDWIVHHGTENIYQVVAIIGNHYQLKYGNTYTVQNCADVVRCARLWDISDAKDGDILASDNGLAFIYNGYLEEQQWPFAYGGINIYGRFNICDGLLPFTHQKVVPATKEQRDTLMKAMADAGYTFDFEKKELKKIEQPKLTKFEDAIREIKTRIAQCNGFNRKNREEVFSLLDSLRPQSTWKPSEEQLDSLYDVLNPCDGFNREVLESLYQDLKKL